MVEQPAAMAPGRSSVANTTFSATQYGQERVDTSSQKALGSGTTPRSSCCSGGEPMRYAVAVILVSFVTTPAWSQSLRQQTEGWCSPAVADVKGHVTITCQGVDPKALARLNELLDKKDLELTQRIKEANEWAERYRELSARLATAGDDGQLSQQAKALIQDGKFDEAGAVLDRLIVNQESEVEQLAANHFNRAELFRLQ